VIIVRLIGGIGNQMFQYAVGRSLADRLCVPLKLDTTGFIDYTLRSYSLWAFNIAADVASREEIIAATGQTRFARSYGKVARRLPWLPRRDHIVRETSQAFEAAVLESPDGSYLSGYWQSEKYFLSVAERLHAEFTVRPPLQGSDREIARQIGACESVSLHVRRGDYVSNETTAKHHGTCGIDYYDRSVAYIAERVEEPHYFVFSDDPAWAVEHLHLSHPMTVIAHNGASRDFQDLRLMSLCDHHVVANSSFSWWGAWLGANGDGVVVSPKRWFAGKAPEDAVDIPASGWVSL
jgi:hypothetical protein